MKLKYFFLLLLSLYIINCTFYIEAQATIRYVSKSGTSTPPYTNWQTAADSIQKCINICVNGDTVYVANGVYNESIYVDKTINLWGSSADSTVINGVGTPNNYILYFSENNSTLKNFKIISPGQPRTGIASWKTNLQAENCWISNVYLPLNAANSSVIIEKFFINNFDNRAFRDECPADTCKGIYRDNIIISTGATETPVYFGYGGYPTFTNNIVIEEGDIWTGVSLGTVRGAIIKNNLIAGFKRIGIQIGNVHNDTVFAISNNILYLKDAYGAFSISSGNRTHIKNNIISNSYRGIEGLNSNDPARANYNLFWNVDNLTVGSAILGDSNIVADPMFVKDTLPNPQLDYDFHLQKYSAAIDKGDPSILDVDGTRSDIGMYGGAGGEQYVYLDLPPKTPRNFSYSFDSTNTFLTINWDMNYEADFKNYKIYRDTITGFIPNQFNLIAASDTSFITENITEFTSDKIYYRVSAVDNHDNESQPGNEISVTITGIEPVVEILRDYILYQNYPNPFNPSTRISYEIKERAYVKLMVYDIKGELVTVLVNKEQTAGYYEVEFSVGSQPTGQVGLQSTVGNQTNATRNLASGIYLYRIEVISEGRIPVYTDMKKMLMIK